jgi:formylglycine-generating enzyme required for sulfatase activity
LPKSSHKHIVVLPSTSFADVSFLQSLADTLQKGAGDLVFLMVHSGNGKDYDKDAMNTLLRKSLMEVDNDCVVWKQLMGNVNDKMIPYLVSHSQEDFYSSDEETLKSLDDIERPELDNKAQCLTHADALRLFSLTSFRCIVFSKVQDYTLYILERPMISFPPLVPSPSIAFAQDKLETKSASTPFGVPALSEWQALWAAWDLVTLRMIPPAMLHQKPIDLRHKCLFYIGHIPTFLDMLMSKALGEPNTEPKHFTTVFERGIDPHVDDPDHCHSHSEVPEADEDWPVLSAILEFRDRVRARLVRLYDDLASGKRTINRNIARMLVLTLEHEGFHVETLLYMLLQRAGTGTLPPPGFATPAWSALSAQWDQFTPPLSSSTTTLGPTTLILGHDDSEADDHLPELMHDVDGHEFGWDNESPQRSVEVVKFKIDWRPVTNMEFYSFWRGEGKGQVEMPKSWVNEDGDIKVRTLHHHVSMEVAKDWPVLTSYDDLDHFARHKGGRLPTEPELRLFFDKYEVGHEGGANVGFRNWHPIPATTGNEENGGIGSNGGVWEWTATLFDGHEGLVPTKHFTGYSTDFFDGKHHVVLGASYVTIPRLARRTLRNFYQHNYPYPWVGARVAYDL